MGSASILVAFLSLGATGCKNGQSVQDTGVTGPPAATVTVSAPSSILQPGQTAQATATVRDANGNVLAGRPITWTSVDAGIATVSGGGLVSAVAEGSTTITATSEGKSGGVAVTVHVPAPVNNAAEPAGATLLTQRSLDATTEDGWGISNNGAGLYTIVQDATAPRSPPNVGQMKYPAGFVAGGAPADVGRQLAGTARTLYVSYWVKLSSNWVGHSSGVNKQLFIWTGGNPGIVTSATGDGSSRLVPQIRLQGIANLGELNLDPNLVPSATVLRGVWHHWEVVLVHNTGTSTDGSIDWYFDGVHVGNKAGVEFTAGSGSWDLIQWGPTWGGAGGPNVPVDQFMWMDNIYVSTR